jgi:RNA polymerase sigma-70 factor (ECF subfamily)
MSQLPEEFAALVARARQADPAALAELVRQYEPEIRRVARVCLGPALRPYLDSMDLVQSVHRSLLAGLRQEKFDLSQPQQLIALAATMVRRKAARHWRRARRQVRLFDATAGARQQGHALAALGGAGQDPAGAVQLADRVAHLCRGLSETERRLVELRVQGYSTAEVARQLGVDADVLSVRLSRLRQRLRAEGALAEWL